MIGAIVGDIVGSIYEFSNHKDKDFEFYGKGCTFTDDTVCTVAIADFYLDAMDKGIVNEKRVLQSLSKWYHLYPNLSYGSGFRKWVSGITMDNIKTYPYNNSYGNGAAMRISPIGDIFEHLPMGVDWAELVTKCSHGHKEGIKGAQAVVSAMFMAKSGADKELIRSFIEKMYDYSLEFNMQDLIENYKFDETCQNTVPQAIYCFLESNDFEDAIRNAIAIGGDSDTIAAITGSIAQAYYKDIPEWILEGALKRLPKDIKDIISEWYDYYDIEITYPKISKTILKLLD